MRSSAATSGTRSPWPAAAEEAPSAPGEARRTRGAAASGTGAARLLRSTPEAAPPARSPAGARSSGAGLLLARTWGRSHRGSRGRRRWSGSLRFFVSFFWEVVEGGRGSVFFFRGRLRKRRRRCVFDDVRRAKSPRALARASSLSDDAPGGGCDIVEPKSRKRSEREAAGREKTPRVKRRSR